MAERRRRRTAELRAMLPPCPAWEAWLDRPPELARAATAAGPHVVLVTPPDFRCGAPARDAVISWLRDRTG